MRGMPSAQNPSRSLVSDAQGEGLAADSHETLVEAFDATEDLEPRSGEAFGCYVLLECIGRGGMGLVYAAYDPQLDRRIALELLRRAEAPDPRARARLLREAQAIAREALPLREAVHGPHDPFVANTLTGLGEVLIELQRPREAVEALDRAMKIREAVDPDVRARARTRFALARAVQHAGSTRHDSKALAHAALAELQPLTDDKLAARSREDIESWLRDL